MISEEQKAAKEMERLYPQRKAMAEAVREVFSKRNAEEIIAYLDGVLSGAYKMPSKLLQPAPSSGEVEEAIELVEEWMQGNAHMHGYGCLDTIITAAQETERLKELLRDHEEANDDKKRLVREIDAIISYPHAPAKQASLCDLISPIKQLRARIAELEKSQEWRDTEQLKTLAAISQIKHDMGKTKDYWFVTHKAQVEHLIKVAQPPSIVQDKEGVE